MTRFVNTMRTVWATRDTGAVAAEYGLLLILIAVVVIGALALLGTQVLALFQVDIFGP